MHVLTVILAKQTAWQILAINSTFSFLQVNLLHFIFSSIQIDLWCYLLGLHCGMEMDIPCLFVYYEIRVHTHTTEDQYELNSAHTMTGSV
jgi:hypothetical protein